MPSISWSEVNLFRKCMQAHEYRYGQRLERKKPILPMLRGKILHEMLHNHILTKQLTNYEFDAWDALEKYAEEFKTFFEEEKEEHGDILGEIERIFLGYLKRYKNDDLKYEDSEVFVATDLSSHHRFIGYIDKVAVDQHKRRWLMDHKFHKSIPSAEDRFHELQLIMYIWAWNRWEPSRRADGIVWDYVRTAPPTMPAVLQSGELSQKASLRCDRATYEEEIKRLKLDPKPYQPYLKKLERNDLMFFERVFLPAPSAPQIMKIVEDFRTTASMIENMKGIHPRSMSKFNCQGCQFKPLCEADVRGLDVNFVKKAYYRKRERFDGSQESITRQAASKKKSTKKRTKKRKVNR